MKEVIIVFVVLAFSLYGLYAAFVNGVKKAVKISREIRKEKNRVHEGGEKDI